MTLDRPCPLTRIASRHSRCCASAFLTWRTAAKGRLCLSPQGRGGASGVACASRPGRYAERERAEFAASSFLPLPRIPISPGGRRLDHDRFTGVDDGGVAALQPLHAAILPAHEILADLAGFAAGESERLHVAVAGQDRALHPLEEPAGAGKAVAGLPCPAPARTLADVKILEQHRIAELEHLRIGEARVGHVCVHGVGAVEAGAGGRAGADRLVVLMARVAEIEVVHGALGRKSTRLD